MPFRSQTSWIPGENDFTRRNITTSSENPHFSRQTETPQIEKGIGFVNSYRNYNPRMDEKLDPFHKLLKTKVPINITSGLKETFDSVNKALSDACELELNQPSPGKQLVVTTDARFGSAGYALMIENNPDQNVHWKRKKYAPVAFGSKYFSPVQLKMSMYSKDFLALDMAFLEFAHNLWHATKPTIVLIDNKCVTSFFPNQSYSASTVECMWICVAI